MVPDEVGLPLATAIRSNAASPLWHTRNCRVYVCNRRQAEQSLWIKSNLYLERKKQQHKIRHEVGHLKSGNDDSLSWLPSPRWSLIWRKRSWRGWAVIILTNATITTERRYLVVNFIPWRIRFSETNDRTNFHEVEEHINAHSHQLPSTSRDVEKSRCFWRDRVSSSYICERWSRFLVVTPFFTPHWRRRRRRQPLHVKLCP